MIYENICYWAKKRGLTFHQIEKRGVIGNGVIARWKNSKPSIDNLQKVANVLGVSVNTLLKERKESEDE